MKRYITNSTRLETKQSTNFFILYCKVFVFIRYQFKSTLKVFFSTAVRVERILHYNLNESSMNTRCINK